MKNGSKSNFWDILEDPERIHWAENIDLQIFYSVFDYFLGLIFQSSKKSPPKRAAEDITSFCRGMISDKQSKGQYDDVHKFCKHYRAYSETIMNIAGIVEEDEFSLFYVPLHKKNKISNISTKIPQVFLHPNNNFKEYKLATAAIWGHLEKKKLLKEDFTRRNVKKMHDRARQQAKKDRHNQ